jgi:CspA family cold shock protein
MTGTIKRLVRPRGFGFIRDDQGMEFFFHRSAVTGTGSGYDALQEGGRVAFDEQDGGAKGPRAINVQPS